MIIRPLESICSAKRRQPYPAGAMSAESIPDQHKAREAWCGTSARGTEMPFSDIVMAHSSSIMSFCQQAMTAFAFRWPAQSWSLEGPLAGSGDLLLLLDRAWLGCFTGQESGSHL